MNVTSLPLICTITCTGTPTGFILISGSVLSYNATASGVSALIPKELGLTIPEIAIFTSSSKSAIAPSAIKTVPPVILPEKLTVPAGVPTILLVTIPTVPVSLIFNIPV
ncbi:MAG TPA: hypothetical protein LFV90_01290 [Rickettsia endosymbiont of Columbicola hoogstraali]|nr:hypothetical protein [Rickettsia endosymbiont of Columbicola hoogstraali]